MIATGGYSNSIKEFNRQDVKGSRVIDDIKAVQAIIAGTGYLFSLDNIIDNPIFKDENGVFTENKRDMETLATTVQLMPHLTSLSEDGKTVQISSRTLRPDMFPNSSMLLADGYLTQSLNQGWEGLDDNLYNNLVTASLNEVLTTIGTDRATGKTTLSEKGFALVEALTGKNAEGESAIPLIGNTQINLGGATFESTSELQKLADVIRASRPNLVTDDSVTLSTIVSTLEGVTGGGEAAEPLEIQSPVINASNLSLSDLSDRIKRTDVTDEQRRESSGYLLNAISSFLK
jgi:hypothetical protein